MSLFNIFNNNKQNKNIYDSVNIDHYINSLKLNSADKIPKGMSKRDIFLSFKYNTDKVLSSYDIENGLVLPNFVEILAIDDKNKIFYTIVADNIYKYEFSKLMDVQISHNTKTYVSGKGLTSIAGGLAFGVPGAIAGSAGKRKVKTKETHTYFKLILNDLNTSVINITIENVVFGRADEFLGALNYILNNK